MFEHSFDVTLSKTSNLQHSASMTMVLSPNNQARWGGTDSTGDEELCVIFPCIPVVADAEPDPITSGVGLRKCRSVKAAKELDLKKPPSLIAVRGPQNRTGLQRSRKISISTNSGGPFLPQTSR